MAKFFTSPKDLADWVNKLGHNKAATVISNLPRVGEKHIADIIETTNRIVEANDANAADVLFEILKVAGVTEDEVSKTEDGVEQVRAANELLKSKVITADEHASMVKQAYVQRQVVTFDMPLRICPKRLGKEVVSTYNCRHYCSNSFTLDDDPMRVYCAELLWRRHVADKFSSDYQDRKTGELVGGYINDRFYKFPTAGTPDNPDSPRNGGNPMMLKPGERTRTPRPHQWSVERRMQEMREKNSTKDITLGKKASSRDGWLTQMISGEKLLVKNAQTVSLEKDDENVCKMCGKAIRFNGGAWVHVVAGSDHIAVPQDSPKIASIKQAQATGFVDFSFDSAGNLVMTPTSAGVEQAKELLENGDTSDNAFVSMIEDQLSNGWELIRPEELGALTNALIICRDCERDDDGKLISIGDVWSNIDFYQVRSEIQDFAENQPITWAKAPQVPTSETTASSTAKTVEAKKKKGKPVNPWAVCTKTVGREDADKYERCVLDVKKEHPVKAADDHIAKQVILAAGRDNFVKISISKTVEATCGDENALQVFSMAVDLKNQGVSDEDAIVKISDATGMPIASIAGIQSIALQKLAAHVSDAYSTEPEKNKPRPKELSDDETQEAAAELGLTDDA